MLGTGELTSPSNSLLEIEAMPFPNPASPGSFVNIPLALDESLQGGWRLVDQSGKSIAIEWLEVSRQIQLPATISPGYYFIDHPLHAHRWPLKVH
jgi:hypothetical protein